MPQQPTFQITPTAVQGPLGQQVAAELALFNQTAIEAPLAPARPNGSGALADDQTTTNPTVADTTVSQTLIPYPNLLRNYASYSPVLSLLVTNSANYNTMVLNATANPNNAFDPTQWDIICKSGGIGPKKAQGFNGGTQTYFSSDMYFDSATVTTLVGMSQENRGGNATEIEMNIIQPYGMDFIEQLYDYCNQALGESNYCQIPYMLMIEFRGWKDDGSNEIVPDATKHIPVHLTSMDIKVNNMGAIYKITALPFNELATTEQYGRCPCIMQIGTEVALDAANGILTTSGQITSFNRNPLFGVNQSLMPTQTETNNPLLDLANVQQLDSLGTQGATTMQNITNSFATILNNVQTTLVNDGDIEFSDYYSITYEPRASSHSGYINKAKFLDFQSLAQSNTPISAKDAAMGSIINKDGLNLYEYQKHIQPFAVDPTTGETGTGVTYGNQLISFNSGSSILECLNVLLINSNYIVKQITDYNANVDKINTAVAAAQLKQGAPIPPKIQEMLDKLNNTAMDWFHIVPIVTQGAYDAKRGIYSRNINYVIQPYTVYNSRSISSPNADPVSNNRVVKEYDYIFTGKNTEIITFDLQFNNAFYTYAQFNHDTKGQGNGAGRPADLSQGTTPTNPPVGTFITSTPMSNGQSTNFVSSSAKAATGIGAQTPERNQASDIAATIYANGEQIQLDLHVYGDPDFIRQDGIFTNPNTSDAFLNATVSNSTRGILFNNGEVYANVNFKIPQDINLSTGVMDLSFEGAVNYKRNAFSGSYRIQTVTNKFDKGLFTQELNMYRYIEYKKTVSTNAVSVPTTRVYVPENDHQWRAEPTFNPTPLPQNLPTNIEGLAPAGLLGGPG